MPVNGIVAHPWVLALDIDMEVAHVVGLEVPAKGALELPVGSDLDGDGCLVLLQGVCGPLDSGGEVLPAWQLSRLADCPVSPLEVDNGKLLSVQDNALCCYPNVKLEIRNLSLITFTAPIFLQFN